MQAILILSVVLVLSACGASEYAVPSRAISEDIDASQIAGAHSTSMGETLDFRDNDIGAPSNQP
ncbi:MAG TPA: hypothetical protein VMU69_09375 [Bradyrhizobium sp.]|nr:hypothetical protein [Bradyrhizobium sp.]